MRTFADPLLMGQQEKHLSTDFLPTHGNMESLDSAGAV